MQSHARRGGVKLTLLVAVAVALVLLVTGVIAFGGAAPAAGWSISTGPGSAPAPGGGEGLLVLCTGDNRVCALDLETGAPRWERDELRAFATPLVVGGRVYVASLDDVVLALDASTGEDVWSAESGGYEFALHAGELLVGRGYGFDVLDAATGDLLWEYRAREDSEDEVQVTEALSVADGVAYVAYSVQKNYTLSFGGRSVVDGGVYAVDLDGGHRLWTSEVDRVLHAPVVTDGMVYVKTSSGLVDSVYALDRADGTTRWEHTGALGIPRLAGGSLCFVNVDSRSTQQGSVPVVEERFGYVGLDPASGGERWSRGAPTDVLGTLEHGEQVLFVREGAIEARDGGSGGRAWRLPIERETSAWPDVAAGRLIVCTQDARLTVYPLE